MAASPPPPAVLTQPGSSCRTASVTAPFLGPPPALHRCECCLAPLSGPSSSEPRRLHAARYSRFDGCSEIDREDPCATARDKAARCFNHGPIVLRIRCHPRWRTSHALLVLCKLLPVKPRAIQAAGFIESENVIRDPPYRGGTRFASSTTTFAARTRWPEN